MPHPSAWAAIGGATSPSFSRDGTRLFHLRGAGLPQVWELTLASGESRQLSWHDEKVAFLRRAPKDDRLVWGIDAGGDERQQLWLFDHSGEVRPLTSAPSVIHDFGAFAPEDDRIAFAANDRSESGFDVSILDLATSARKRLTQGNGQWSVMNWSPAGDRIVVLEDRSSSDQSLHLADVGTGALKEIPRTGLTRYAAVRFASDGNSVLAITDQGGNDFLRLCRIDPETGAAEPVFAPQNRDVEAWALSPDEKLLATIENDRGYAVLRVGGPGEDRLPVEGLPRGVVNDLAWSADSTRLAFSVQAPTVPAGLWIWNAATRGARPVWQPNSMAEAGIDPGCFRDMELVSWTAEDGTEIPGWLARPAALPPPGGYRSVIWVHGGPASQTRTNFRPDIQMLLAQRYAVLMPNVRGSTGYGRAWMEADDRSNRGIAIADLVAGRHWLAAQPGINPERIGIMGQSYGGWAVLAAITQHPKLWRAAVSYYGITDWFTLLRDTGPWRRDHRAREYGFPGRDDAVLEAQSPIRKVSAIAAPLLMAHGDRDPRVPMSQSEQFAQAMARHNKPVRYERFTHAGHGFIRSDHGRRIYTAVAEHFAVHL